MGSKWPGAAILAVATGLILLQCSGNGATHDTASWEAGASSFLKDDRNVGSIGKVIDGQGSLDKSEVNLADLIDRAPTQPNPQQSALLTRLNQERVALAQVAAETDAADATKASLRQDASSAASTSNDRSLTAELTKIANDLLRDVTCDLALQYLDSNEQLSLKSYQRLPRVVADSSRKSLVDYANRTIVQTLGGEVANRWFTRAEYADKIIELARTHTQGLDQLIRGPDWQETRAYYYYARLCLKPPA